MNASATVVFIRFQTWGHKGLNKQIAMYPYNSIVNSGWELYASPLLLTLHLYTYIRTSGFVQLLHVNCILQILCWSQLFILWGLVSLTLPRRASQPPLLFPPTGTQSALHTHPSFLDNRGVYGKPMVCVGLDDRCSRVMSGFLFPQHSDEPCGESPFPLKGVFKQW
jgi:hypothetical protein